MDLCKKKKEIITYKKLYFTIRRRLTLHFMVLVF